MWRTLVSAGPVTIYTYGFMLAAAFLFGIWHAARRAPAYGFTAEQVHDAALPVLLAALLGAKAAYLATSSWHGAELTWREVVNVIRGGFVFYGGLAGGVAGGLWWLKRHGLPALAFGDLIAAPLCFAHALGRIGCFMNGCCYGKAAAWGIVLPEVDTLARIPVQLLEAAGLALAGVALGAVPAPRGGRTGRVLAAYLVLYGGLRFTLELWRDDPRGPVLGGWMTPSQLLALLAAGTGVVLFLVRRRAA